jgi:hypothetical protein
MTNFNPPEGATIDDEGVWCQVLASDFEARRTALFLDRDGVVVDEVHYLRRAQDVRLVAGAATVIAQANRRGLAVVLVTNQAGIGRGILGWPDFARVQERIIAELAPSMPVPITPKDRRPMTTPIIRRASPTRVCCCAPSRHWRLMQNRRGLSAIGPATWKRAAPRALRADCTY